LQQEQQNADHREGGFLEEHMPVFGKPLPVRINASFLVRINRSNDCSQRFITRHFIAMRRPALAELLRPVGNQLENGEDICRHRCFLREKAPSHLTIEVEFFAANGAGGGGGSTMDAPVCVVKG